jgi:membrane-associated protein
VFESLTEYVSGSPWTYVFLFGIAALDVLFPLVPSETSVILAGVLAGTGDLELVLVILFAGTGAVVGDNASYSIGRTAGPWVVGRFFQGARRKRIDWAEKQIEERGPYLIVIGRFIPGGRTAITLAAGLLKMPWRKFISFDVIAGAVWATYAALLGYVGGRTFEENPLYGFLIAFAVALAVTGIIEVYRFLRKRRVLAGG